MVLQYQRGLFLPVGGVSSLDKAAYDMKAEDVFLTVLGKLIEQGQEPSPQPQATAMRQADSRASRSQGLQKERLAAAMGRLFERNRIHVEEVSGRPDKPHEKGAAAPGRSPPESQCLRRDDKARRVALMPPSGCHTFPIGI